MIMAGRDSVPGGGGSGFRLSVEALEVFQGALQGVLADLLDSADSPVRTTRYAIGETALGVSFDEAAMIGGVLKETADRLQMLIRSLQGQIVSMRQRVEATGKNTTATDDDQRRIVQQVDRVLNGGSYPVVGGSAPQVPEPSRRVDLG